MKSLGARMHSALPPNIFSGESSEVNFASMSKLKSKWKISIMGTLRNVRDPPVAKVHADGCVGVWESVFERP